MNSSGPARWPGDFDRPGEVGNGVRTAAGSATVMSLENMTDRLVTLESSLAHLQHDFEQVHQVALELQRELRQLTLRLQRLEQRFELLGEEPEVRSPEEERPPHY